VSDEGVFRVETRSEPRRGQVLVRFGWPGQLREVVEQLDTWEGEDHRYFRVRADDGAVYILRYDLNADRWQLHFFREGS
jgi:hypothetical protein